jgi:hypothetical protein
MWLAMSVAVGALVALRVTVIVGLLLGWSAGGGGGAVQEPFYHLPFDDTSASRGRDSSTGDLLNPVILRHFLQAMYGSGVDMKNRDQLPT